MFPDVDFTEIRRADGTRLVVAISGSGPLVLMVHGFPESWISWRHQMKVIADAGFTAAALQTRGYGDSDKPVAIEAYTVTEMAGDIAAVISALDPSGAVLIGHDWGAAQVQAAALIHPELVRALVTLSVPIMPHLSDNLNNLWAELYPDNLFYQTYFQEPGRAEAELEADPRRFVRLFFYWMSGDRPGEEHVLIRPGGAKTLLEGLADPDPFPAWLSPAELDYYAAGFAHDGFRGPLNRYRATDLDFIQMAPYAERRFMQPTMFVGGSRDPVRTIFPGQDIYASPLERCDDPRGAHIIEGAGHWIQQEAPYELNALLLPFLEATRELGPRPVDDPHPGASKIGRTV
ncbi:MAG: alpha/beta hydrolase [Novosphingobium sp.]